MKKPGPSFVADPPWAMVPYHDPHDDSKPDHLLQCFHAENPTLSDLYDPPSQHTFNPIPPVSSNVDRKPSKPIQGPGMAATGSSSNREESCLTKTEDLVLENGTILSYSLVPSEPFNCSRCQLLRTITHTNGKDTTRLEIHGQIGTIYHAILFNSMQRYRMFDFSKKSIEEVKQFLTHYMEERREEGYVALLDPLAEFYDALSVGVGKVESLDDFFRLSIASSEASENEEVVRPRANRPPRPSNRPPRPSNRHRGRRNNLPRSGISLSEQRARTRKMTIKDLAPYFYLPIEDAAQLLKTCPTVLKRICRRHGIERWPHRMIKGINGRILRLEKKCRRTANIEKRRSFKAEIKKGQAQIAEICFGIPRALP